MKTIEFYRSECGNHEGHKLDDILKYTNEELELGHDYIQWIFPSNEPSMLNCDAPVMTREESQVFQADPELQEKVKQAFVRFLSFLKFEMAQDDNTVVVQATEELPWWLRRFNHNNLRVTRMLKCLRLVGLEKHAAAMFEGLKPFKHMVSENSWNYWHDATLADLWGEDYTPLHQLRKKLAPLDIEDNDHIDPELL